MEKNWYNLSVKETETKLETDLEAGLTTEQVTKAREKYGYNELKAQKKKSLFVKFLEQFKDFMIIILIIAAIISGVIGYMQGEGITDSIIIFIVIIVIEFGLITTYYFICQFLRSSSCFFCMSFLSALFSLQFSLR